MIEPQVYLPWYAILKFIQKKGLKKGAGGFAVLVYDYRKVKDQAELKKVL